jgi:hypothetical protein
VTVSTSHTKQIHELSGAVQPINVTVTVNRPIALANQQVCISGRFCLDSAYVPFLSVLAVLLAALVAGRYAVLAATKQADGAYRAAREQSEASIKAAMQQAEAILEVQLRANQHAETLRRQADERVARAKRRRLVPLLRDLSMGFWYLATTPLSPWSDVMDWRMSELERYSENDFFIEMFTDDQAFMLYKLIDSAKSNYILLQQFKVNLHGELTDEGREDNESRAHIHGRYVLERALALLNSLDEKKAVSWVKRLLEDIPSKETEPKGDDDEKTASEPLASSSEPSNSGAREGREALDAS